MLLVELILLSAGCRSRQVDRQSMRRATHHYSANQSLTHPKSAPCVSCRFNGEQYRFSNQRSVQLAVHDQLSLLRCVHAIPKSGQRNSDGRFFDKQWDYATSSIRKNKRDTHCQNLQSPILTKKSANKRSFVGDYCFKVCGNSHRLPSAPFMTRRSSLLRIITKYTQPSDHDYH